MQDTRCTETRYHEGHRHTLTVIRVCNGITPCGLRTHNNHEFEKVEFPWCPGICDCGMGERHGPGEHK